MRFQFMIPRSRTLCDRPSAQQRTKLEEMSRPVPCPHFRLTEADIDKVCGLEGSRRRHQIFLKRLAKQAVQTIAGPPECAAVARVAESHLGLDRA